MEDNILQLLKRCENSESSDSSSDVSFESSQYKSTDGNYLPSTSEPRLVRKRKGSQRNGERLPTRRPDPNIYNRNALLARENRRKKKAHLETIEKELGDARSANQALLKALKKQLKTVRKLEKEKQYFKSILTNRTEILSLVTSLNARLPLQSPHNLSVSLNQVSVSASPTDSLNSNYRERSSSSCDPEPLSVNFDNSDTGSVATTHYSCKDFSAFNKTNFLDNFFTDFEPTSTYDDPWNEMLDSNFGLKASPELEPSLGTTDIDVAYKIGDEHSYFTQTETAIDNKSDDAGVCLHIARGKVSLEFCPSCHWNACRTPPTQLLQDDALA